MAKRRMRLVGILKGPHGQFVGILRQLRQPERSRRVETARIIHQLRSSDFVFDKERFEGPVGYRLLMIMNEGTVRFWSVAAWQADELLQGLLA